MDRNKRNILSLILSMALSCTLIPLGIAKGWGIVEYVVGVASFIISGLIAGWDNEAAFHRYPDAGIRFGYHIGGSFCVCFGAQGLWGLWGEALLLKVIGSALMITGAILIRVACRTKRDG